MAPMKTASTARSARIMAALRRRWYVVLLAMAVGAVGAFALSYLVPPSYTSTTTLFFSLRSGGSASDINQGSTYTQNQMLSFAQLATSSLVLDEVIKDVGAETTKEHVRQSMSVATPPNTAILDVKVATGNRELSAKIANSVATNLSKAVSTVSPGESSTQAGVVANVIEPAFPAEFQSAPDKRKNAVLGGIFGMALAILAIVGTAIFDTRVRSVDVLKSLTPRPLLGSVEQNQAIQDNRPIAVRSPNGSAAERFRQIRAGLRFAAASHDIKVMAVTSAIPSEGKTHTALNLAIVMAETKERVLLIDADLRRPSVANTIAFEGAVGLTTVLVGDVAFEGAVQPFGNTTLDILAGGTIPPNPAELLGSARMRTLIEHAKQQYDVVIIDTAPVLAVADLAVIAEMLDSIVWVVDSKKLRQAQFEQASETLDAIGGHVSGIILNRVKPLRIHDVYYQEEKSEPLHSKKKSHPRAVVPETTDADISSGRN